MPYIDQGLDKIKALLGYDPSQPVDESSPVRFAEGVGRAADSVTGAPIRAAAGAAINGDDPIKAYSNQFADDPSKAPTGEDIINALPTEAATGTGQKIGPQLAKILGMGVDAASQGAPMAAAGALAEASPQALKALGPLLADEEGALKASIKARQQLLSDVPNFAYAQRSWQEGSGPPTTRDALANYNYDPSIRLEMLRRLSAATSFQRNPDTGELEFLLHRGAQSSENPVMANSTSWTPDPQIAAGFAKRAKESFGDGRVMSAYIPEKNIAFMPKLMGNLGEKGPNPYDVENEVFVKGLHGLMPVEQDELKAMAETVHNRINSRADKSKLRAAVEQPLQNGSEPSHPFSYPPFDPDTGEILNSSHADNQQLLEKAAKDQGLDLQQLQSYLSTLPKGEPVSISDANAAKAIFGDAMQADKIQPWLDKLTGKK